MWYLTNRYSNRILHRSKTTLNSDHLFSHTHKDEEKLRKMTQGKGEREKNVVGEWRRMELEDDGTKLLVTK